MYFVKMPNMIFEFDLSPMAFMVYCSIKSFAGRDQAVILKAATIARRCHIHRNSVYTAINELQASGLISIEKRQQENGYKASHRYVLAGLSGKWFKIDFRLFSYTLNPSVFMVLAYLQSKANHAGRAFPSYTQINAATGLCQNTIIKAIGVIRTLKLGAKKHYLRIINRFGHNNYSLGEVFLKIAGTITKKTVQLFAISCTAIYIITCNLCATHRLLQAELSVKVRCLNRAVFYRKI